MPKQFRVGVRDYRQRGFRSASPTPAYLSLAPPCANVPGMAETVVLVNGVPGSGKSTLAVPLAARLGLPLLGRDVVKESLFDSLGVRDRAWSRELGRASAGVLWSLVPFIPGPVVIDNNVASQIRDLFCAEARAAGVKRILEIWCEVPPQVAFDRYRERALTTRHPGHGDAENGMSLADMSDRNSPLDVGPLLRLPTDREVDVTAAAAWVRGRLSDRLS